VYAHAQAHLQAAARLPQARALLLRFAWLRATLAEAGVHALLARVAAAMLGHAPLSLLHRALLLAAPGLQAADAPDMLAGALAGRLMASLRAGGHASIAALHAEACAWRGAATWLRPLRATLRQPAGPLAMQLDGHASMVVCLAALPGTGCCVSGSWDTTLRVWDTASGDCAQRLVGHTDWVTCVAALPGARCASGSRDATLRLWDAATGECERVRALAGAPSALTALRDGRLAYALDGGALRLWDDTQGDDDVQLCSHGGGATVTCIAELLLDADAAAPCLATGSSDAAVRVWALDGAAPAAVLLLLEGHTKAVLALAALPGGRLASASADATLRLWDARAGACERVLTAHEGMVTCVAALRDGRLVSASWDKTLRLWDATTGECERVLEGHMLWVTAAAALPDGRVASASYDQTVCVWEVDDAAEQEAPGAHEEWITSLATLADGRLLSGSDDCTLRLWDPATGACERVLEGHLGLLSATAALAAPEGAAPWVLRSCGASVQVWDAATGECVRALRGHADLVTCVAALPAHAAHAAAGARALSG
jgi:WD40 repeat protein